MTLDDILGIWSASAPYKAGGSTLLIMADCCCLGKLVERLCVPCTSPDQYAARTVAVQAACGGSDELTYGRIFFLAYINKVENKGQTARQLFEQTGFLKECLDCRNYR